MAASATRASIRWLAVSLVFFWSSSALSFPALDKWTSHGGTGSNPCYTYPGTQTCVFYETAEEAGLSRALNFYCPSPAYYSNGAYPNDTWRLNYNAWPNCNGPWYTNFVRRQPSQKYCSANSTQSGTTCTCKPGFLDTGESCHGGKNNGQPCPACGNPIHPATGNKYQREPIYPGPHGSISNWSITATIR